MIKKLLIYFALILITSIGYAQQPIKRVLLEQHTGAWCGWCVDGTVKMEELETAYPEQVIGVKFHNGDSMAIPEQTTIGNAMGLTGFPTGSLNRVAYNGAIFIDRTNWMNAAKTEMNKAALVDVSLTYSLDESTRELVATITCTALADINEDLSFNVYVVEDSCSGTGIGWNQSNYYSKNSTYPTHPYYNLPNPIVGYQHMKVVRQLLGGPWGEAGEITNPAKKGTVYHHSFKTTLNSKWVLSRLHFVGLVQANSATNKAVYNCALGQKGAPINPTFQIASSDNGFDVKKSNETFTRKFSVTNISSSDVTAKPEYVNATSTPSDWTITVSPSQEFIIKPNETKEVSISITPSGTIGIGSAQLIISDKNNSGAIKVTGKIGAVSGEIEKFEVISGANATYSLQSNLAATKHSGYFSLDPSYFTPYIDKFTNKKVVIYNTGASGSLGSADAEAAITALKNKTSVMIVGNLVVSALNQYKLMNFFNAEFSAVSREGYGSSPWRIWLQGFDGDIISSSFGSNQEGNLILYLLTTMNITDKKKTKPVLAFTKSKDSIVALRTYYNGAKGFLMGVCQNVIVDVSTRNKLISNAIDWLEGTLIESVNDGESTTNDGLINLSVMPNPFENNSKIVFKLKGNQSQNIHIYMINEAGQIVSEISNGSFEPGEHEFIIRNNVPNGNYRIILDNSKEQITLPVIKIN